MNENHVGIKIDTLLIYYFTVCIYSIVTLTVNYKHSAFVQHILYVYE